MSDQNLISLLINENSRKILLSLIESEKSSYELSSTLHISLSTTYRILKYLEDEGLIKVSRMILNSEGHHSKIYRAKFKKIILIVDSKNIKVHFMLDESEKLKDIWKKLGELS